MLSWLESHRDADPQEDRLRDHLVLISELLGRRSGSLASLFHDLGKLDSNFEKRLAQNARAESIDGLLSILRNTPSEQLEMLASKGAINFADAMDAAAIALARTSDMAVSTVQESSMMGRDIADRSHRISSAQSASRALIEGLVRG